MANEPTPIQEIQVRLAAILEKDQTTPGGPGTPRQRGKALADDTFGKTEEEPEKGEKESRKREETSATGSESWLGRTRALVNAVAVGPERAAVTDRRLMLARLLAQRRQREVGSPGQWTRLSNRLIAEIEALEAESGQAGEQLTERPLAANTQQIADAVQERRMAAVEDYLHGLDRAVSAHAVRQREKQQTEGEEGTTSELLPPVEPVETSGTEERGGDDDK